ncbi:MAG: hypothetical protein JXR83_14755 [Deltaproteobacteria bacterium]|nr:hypothetical protein [Deltaproteobacteria bacterium]
MPKVKIELLAKELGLTAAVAEKRLRAAGFAAHRRGSGVDREAALAVLRRGGEEAAEGQPRATRRYQRRSRPDVAPGTIVIKKYGNRRLYSTEDSRYLTLEELEALVRGGRKVLVVDAADDEDLTAQVLTQILLEGGRAKQFPVAFLEQIIRLGDEALQSFFNRYLMAGLEFFLAAQREWDRSYGSGFGGWPFGAFPGAAPGWFGAPAAAPSTAAAPASASADPTAGASPTSDGELAKLRARLADLERQVNDRAMPARRKTK